MDKKCQTTESQSGRIGFTWLGDPPPSSIIVLGSVLRLDDIPQRIQELIGVGPTAEVTVTRFDGSGRFGILFNGLSKEISLQRLGAGVSVVLLENKQPITPPPTKWNPFARAGVPASYFGQMPNGTTVRYTAGARF